MGIEIWRPGAGAEQEQERCQTETPIEEMGIESDLDRGRRVTVGHAITWSENCIVFDV